MRIFWFVTLGLLMLASLPTVQQPVAACSISTETAAKLATDQAKPASVRVRESLEQAALVFRGHIVAIGQEANQPPKQLVTFSVDTVWKGQAAPSLRFTQQTGCTNPNFSGVGDYIVYAQDSIGAEMAANAFRIVSGDSSDDLQGLGVGSPPTAQQQALPTLPATQPLPSRTTPSSNKSNLSLILYGGGIVALLAALIVVQRRLGRNRL
jgi:hypothetical protein